MAISKNRICFVYVSTCPVAVLLYLYALNIRIDEEFVAIHNAPVSR